MAKKPKEGGETPEAKFVTIDQFNSLQDSIVKLMDMVTPKAGVSGSVDARVAPPVTATATIFSTEDVTKAGPKYMTPVNPEWEEVARKFIGEKLDHCEVDYKKNGGVEFTLVIKNEYSNAPKDYLERMKTDRRSIEVGHSGIEGVTQWCKLVAQNLTRG